MKVLIFGKDGQVGRALQQALPASAEVLALGRQDADLTDFGSLEVPIDVFHPDVVINAAAYTAVDKAEDDRELAWRINAEAVGVIGAAAKQNGALVVHYSTDYVYAGDGDQPQAETDTTSPASVYGASKLAGEALLRDSGADHIIVRTSWVYAPQGRNFPLTILRLAKERDSLDVVADQVGAPTSASLIADVTARIIGDAGGHTGTYNLAAAGETSWHALAQFLVREAGAAGADLRLAADAIRPILAKDYPAKAARPANSRLDTSELRQTFGIGLLPWQEGIAQLIKTLAHEGRL